MPIAGFGTVDGATAADGFIDWEVIKSQWWTDFLDGSERRMAECLVHGRVPWEAFELVGAKNDVVAASVRKLITRNGLDTPVATRRNWYFR